MSLSLEQVSLQPLRNRLNFWYDLIVCGEKPCAHFSILLHLKKRRGQGGIRLQVRVFKGMTMDVEHGHGECANTGCNACQNTGTATKQTATKGYLY